MAESRKNITTQEIVEELKNRGKSSDEILEFLYSNEKHAVNAETKGKENEITKDENDIKKQVTNILRELGMPAHIKGYRYARYAIILIVKNPEYLSAITKKLYPDVAKELNTTSSRVERAIRHAIEVAWERGADESWKKYFGNTVANMKKNPTNSEFVATISDVIKIKR